MARTHLTEAAKTILAEASANDKKFAAVMELVRNVTDPVPLTKFKISKGVGGYFISDGDGNTWKILGEKS
jgi:hypothetical protein